MEQAIDNDAGAPDAPEGARAPWHFWLAGLVSLLWNAFGGYDYTMTQLRDPAYFASMESQTGMSAAEMTAFFDAFPAWASALWAIGVWGSIAGSILLLMRSRQAATAFVISFVAALLSFIYQATLELPPAMDTTLNKAMPLVILGAIVLQWWYARRMRTAGVLR